MKFLKRSAAILLLLPLVFVYNVFAASAGPEYGTGSNDNAVGTIAWANTSNIGADDASTAGATLAGGNGTDSNYLKVLDLGFSIPSGATINGIVLEAGVSGNFTGVGDDNSVRLVKGGTIGGDNKASGTDYSTSETLRTYGSSSDLWGLAWTDTDINATTFGAVFSANRVAGTDSFTVAVDYMRITVHYTEAAGGGGSQTREAKVITIF